MKMENSSENIPVAESSKPSSLPGNPNSKCHERVSSSTIGSFLKRKLSRDYLEQKPQTDQNKDPFFYIEPHKVIELANDIFGFDGWSHSILEQKLDFEVEKSGRYTCAFITQVRVEITSTGTYHEDIGCGVIINSRLPKIEASQIARKKSVDEAVCRSLRFFGNALGNCLGDLEYLIHTSRKSSCSTAQEQAANHLITTETKFPTDTAFTGDHSEEYSSRKTSDKSVQTTVQEGVNKNEGPQTSHPSEDRTETSTLRNENAHLKSRKRLFEETVSPVATPVKTLATKKAKCKEKSPNTNLDFRFSSPRIEPCNIKKELDCDSHPSADSCVTISASTESSTRGSPNKKNFISSSDKNIANQFCDSCKCSYKVDSGKTKDHFCELPITPSKPKRPSRRKFELSPGRFSPHAAGLETEARLKLAEQKKRELIFSIGKKLQSPYKG